MKLENLQKFSEEELTKEYILPLFKSMGYSDVKYTHGKDEFGRDLVFYREDPFGNKKWKCSQIKAKDIHGSNAKKGNIQEVVNQIREALKNPYFSPRDNNEYTVQEIYIVTSGKITSKARRVINNELENDPIYFLDGQDLLKELEDNNLLNKKGHAELSFNIGEKKKESNELFLPQLLEMYEYREELSLDKEEEEYISRQIVRRFLDNENFEIKRKLDDKKLLKWLGDIDNSSRFVEDVISEFISEISYYERYGLNRKPNELIDFLNELKLQSPEIYKSLDFKAESLVQKLNKMIDADVGVRGRKVLGLMLEDLEILDPFIDTYDSLEDSRHSLYIFIGLENFQRARHELEDKNPLEISEVLIESLELSLGRTFSESHRKILPKLLNLLEDLEYEKEEIIDELPKKYQFVFYWKISRDEKAKNLLSDTKTYENFSISTNEFLPSIFDDLIGERKEFFDLINLEEVPDKPEVFYELAEIKKDQENYSDAVDLLEKSLDNLENLEVSYLERYMVLKKADCHIELKQYEESTEILKDWKFKKESRYHRLKEKLEEKRN